MPHDSDAVPAQSPQLKYVGQTPFDVPHAGPLQPRIWTVFVALLAAFCACLISQIVGVAGLIIWYIAHGGSPNRLPKEIPELAANPMAFMVLNSLAQLSFVATALAAAWLSPQGISQRLGLIQPSLPIWAIVVAAAGVAVPFTIGLSLAWGLAQFIEPDPS